jgi:hypothetical protein
MYRRLGQHAQRKHEWQKCLAKKIHGVNKIVWEFGLDETTPFIQKSKIGGQIGRIREVGFFKEDEHFDGGVHGYSKS